MERTTRMRAYNAYCKHIYKIYKERYGSVSKLAAAYSMAIDEAEAVIIRGRKLVEEDLTTN